MKKLIFISIIASLFATAVVAQDQKGANVLVPGEPIPIDGPGGGGGITNYYINATGTITKSGYTYKYRNDILPGGLVIAHRVELYNVANNYLDVEWGHKDGSMKTERESTGREPDSYYFSYSSHNYDQILALVAGCFTNYQSTSLKGSYILIQTRINPDTGKVVDVYFTFRRDSPVVNIPVETFRSIELALKDKLTITATDNGRKFNYIEFLWTQDF